MKYLIYLLAFIGAPFFGGFAYSYELPKELNIARQENYPPYIYEQDGNLTGICADLADAAFTMLGISVTYTEYPFARMLKKAEWGQVDAVMMVFKTPEREKYLHYPKNSLFYEHNSFFTKKDTPVIYSGELDDLKGYPIGVVLGFSYGEEFDNAKGIEKEVSVNHELLLRKLRGGRFEVGLGNKHVVSYYANMIGFANSIKFLEPNQFDKEPLFIAFSRKKSGYGKLAEEFSEAIRKLKESGQYQRILDKYNIKQ